MEKNQFLNQLKSVLTAYQMLDGLWANCGSYQSVPEDYQKLCTIFVGASRAFRSLIPCNILLLTYWMLPKVLSTWLGLIGGKKYTWLRLTLTAFSSTFTENFACISSLIYFLGWNIIPYFAKEFIHFTQYSSWLLPKKWKKLIVFLDKKI